MSVVVVVVVVMMFCLPGQEVSRCEVEQCHEQSERNKLGAVQKPKREQLVDLDPHIEEVPRQVIDGS